MLHLFKSCKMFIELLLMNNYLLLLAVKKDMYNY